MINLKQYLIVIFFVLILFLGIFFAVSAKAATIIEDGFETYPEGNLNGQGGWSASANHKVIATSTVQGDKNVKAIIPAFVWPNTSYWRLIASSTSPVSDGIQGYYFRFEDLKTQDSIELRKKDDTQIYELRRVTTALYIYGDGDYQFIKSLATSTWYWLQIEWRSSDKKYRAQINNETSTAWYSGISANTPQQLRISSWNDEIDSYSTGTIYFDHFGETKSTSTIPTLDIHVDTPTDNSTATDNNLINFSGWYIGRYFFINYQINATGTWHNIYSQTSQSETASTSFNFNYYLPNNNYLIWYIAMTYNNEDIPFSYDIENNLYVNVSGGSSYYGSTTAIYLTSSTQYYANHIPAIFGTTTPTIIYTSMTGFATMLLQPAVDLLSTFAHLFEPAKAINYGTSTAESLNLIFSYAQGLDQIVPLHLFWLLLLYIIIFIGLLIFKAIWYIIKLIK